ncbi:glycosyltransferase family A protein [Chromobacterium amazonense]|uniref:glycosyltransferase family A protein n=1 Tax=Chromobacterium amazonense TaxID=1382803 RepID=UPI0011B272A8|nr:glycosyltransferase family A protein [Chromobacterium amazonense]
MTNNEKIIVSMTTISSRIDSITPCLKSLLEQNYDNYEVILNISESPYLIDAGISKEIAQREIPKDIKLSFVENTGPYRKLLPTLQNCSDNTPIITVDDDVIYPNNFISTLITANSIYDCPIAFRGREITVNDKRINNYNGWKKNNLTGSGMAKLPTGKDGILYRKRYFHKNVFNIDLAKKIAPTTDDIWFKWHTALNGFNSVLIFNSLLESFDCVQTDGDSLFESFNKHTNNDHVIFNIENYMKIHYGWTLYSEIKGSNE